jgi:hypothetical protein
VASNSALTICYINAAPYSSMPSTCTVHLSFHPPLHPSYQVVSGPLTSPFRFAIVVIPVYEDPDDQANSPFKLQNAEPFTWSWLSTINRVNSQVQKVVTSHFITPLPLTLNCSVDTGLVVHHHPCGIAATFQSPIISCVLCALFSARGRLEAIYSGAHERLTLRAHTPNCECGSC